MSYIEQRNARLALSRELKHDIETAVYLHATTETELAEREARCMALAKQQGLKVLTICQDLITSEEKDYRRALARLYLPPIPFDIIVVDDLTQFAETQEQVDEIIERFYEQHCYVLPVGASSHLKPLQFGQDGILCRGYSHRSRSCLQDVRLSPIRFFSRKGAPF